MSIGVVDLHKRFGDTLVVSNVTCEIEDGELFVLLGGSGSGKSTILRIIAGLVEPDAGSVVLNGLDVTNLPSQARNTGVVFQNYSIFRHLTASQNIEFGLKVRAVPKAERGKRSNELLELVGLAGLGERYPQQLSGGQQQRVALARALAYRPKVLLLDEPFGALDQRIRKQLRESVKAIQRALKITTILVTHDQEEAFELGDRIGIIERGHLVETGAARQLYLRPRSEYVAGFLGDGNLLAGRINNQSIRLGECNIALRPGEIFEQGAPVRILFRPENVELSKQPITRAGIVNLGSARVLDGAFVGNAERLTLQMEQLGGVRSLVPAHGYGELRITIKALQRSSGSAAGFEAGERVQVGVSDYHLLPPSGLKVLGVLSSREPEPAALDYALGMADACLGELTVLGISELSPPDAAVTTRLALLRSRGESPIPRTSLRTGKIDDTLVLEAQAGAYELVVLATPNIVELASAGADEVLPALIEQVGVPVLLTRGSVCQLRRILICTGGGEPGKADIRFGSRLARLSGAHVTVFHARKVGLNSEDEARVRRHIEQAALLLESLGVHGDTKVGAAPAVNAILDEAARGEYDLIVIGAPSRDASARDLSSEVINRVIQPVVVVPLRD